MNPLSRLIPNSIEGQMVAVLAVSILLLLSFLITFDLVDRKSPLEWAESTATSNRLMQMETDMLNVSSERRGEE